jgi:hypothetical protein
MLGGVAGMFEAPAVTVTLRPPPGLRLVSSQPARAVNAVVGRSTAVTLPTAGSNALKAVAAEAPRTAPVLRLVPTPAVEVAPLAQPTPLIPPVIASTVTASISARRGKVAAPSTKSKSEDEEDRKTGDACQRRLGLRPDNPDGVVNPHHRGLCASKTNAAKHLYSVLAARYRNHLWQCYVTPQRSHKQHSQPRN